MCSVCVCRYWPRLGPETWPFLARRPFGCPGWAPLSVSFRFFPFRRHVQRSYSPALGEIGPSLLAVCSANAFQPPRGGGPRAVLDGLRLSKASASVGCIALEFDGGHRRRCGLPPTLEGRDGTILKIQPVEGASLPRVHPGHSPWPLPSSCSLHLDDGQPS